MIKMEELGWIKLHRRLIDSEIFTSEKGLKVWIWCLLRANHTDTEIFFGLKKIHLFAGQFVFGRDSASNDLKMSSSTVRNWMGVLKKDSYIDIQPTNKYSIVTVLNYTKFQNLDSKKDNKITTKKQQNNTDKNDKNDKNIDTNVSIRGDADINFIIESFSKMFNTTPVDDKPRFEAQNIKKLIGSFIKRNADAYKKEKAIDLSLEFVFGRFIEYLHKQMQNVEVQRLSTVRKHLKAYIYKFENKQNDKQV
jgi:hypothetical protein